MTAPAPFSRHSAAALIREHAAELERLAERGGPLEPSLSATYAPKVARLRALADWLESSAVNDSAALAYAAGVTWTAAELLEPELPGRPEAAAMLRIISLQLCELAGVQLSPELLHSARLR